MSLNLIYLLGGVFNLVSLLLGIWIIGITKNKLKTIAIFLTLTALILLPREFFLLSQNLTGSTISNNISLETLKNLDLSLENIFIHLIFPFLIMLTLYNMKKMINEVDSNVNKVRGK